MYSILHFVNTESCPQGVWSEVLSDLRVCGAGQVSEGLDDVLLSDFHHNAWASGHVLGESYVFGNYTSVYFEELLGSWLIKCEHLES